jgi:succinylglutamic semialdehyde dehydrogenase
VAGIFYTGSFETGIKIRKQLATDYWKVLVLDMGGKNSALIWDDCHYERALHEVIYSSFLSSGQRSESAHQILVHEKIFDKFTSDLHQLSKKCKIGYGFDEKDTPFMGPLITESAMENYLRYQGIAVREGCEEIMRGKSLEKEKRGFYVSPSIHWVKKPDAKSIYQKSEIFGPNIALYKVSDLEEATDIINQSQYGLVSSIYTQNKKNFYWLKVFLEKKK